jgi:hypothetical protein
MTNATVAVIDKALREASTGRDMISSEEFAGYLSEIHAAEPALTDLVNQFAVRFGNDEVVSASRVLDALLDLRNAAAELVTA